MQSIKQSETNIDSKILHNLFLCVNDTEFTRELRNKSCESVDPFFSSSGKIIVVSELDTACLEFPFTPINIGMFM